MHQQDEVRGAMSWVALFVLIAAGVWMIYLTLDDVRTLSVWELHDPERVRPWLNEVAARYAVHGAAMLLLGVFLPLLVRPGRSPAPPGSDQDGSRHSPLGREGRSDSTALPPVGARSATAVFAGWLVSWLRHGLFAVTVLGLGALLSLWVLGRLSLSAGLLFATDVATGLFALTVGLAIGMVWRRSRASLVKQLIMVCAFISVLTTWFYHQVIQPTSLPFEVPSITTTDRERIMEMVRRESVVQENRHEYRIATDDLNKLLGWWVHAKSMEVKAQVARVTELADGEPAEQQFSASVPFPVQGDPKSYLNVQVAGRFSIDYEELELALSRLRVGSLEVPQPVANWLGKFIRRWIVSDQDNMDLLTGIVHAGVDGDEFEVVVTETGIRERRFAKLLRQLQNLPDVSESVRDHLQSFARISKIAKPQEPLFAEIVRDAFLRAQNASQRGSAVEANRAAILALGVTLGHHRLERVVGDCLVGDTLYHITRIPAQSQLQQRADWSRHFWLSAALTLIIDSTLSNAAGLFKEELDALDGGSGFSFGDLMADRAGTEFARKATRDEQNARAIQQWVLADGRDLNQLMPTASDLPEGLTEQQLREQFGGVGGQQYRTLVETMEKRLKNVGW